MRAARPSVFVVALSAASLGLFVACGDDDTVADEADAPPSTVAEGPVAATAVATGDCLNGIVIGAAERAEIESAEVVSCDRPHSLEVYATFPLRPADFELTDPSEYPGRAPVVRAADDGCIDRIEELVGERDAYGLIALWPSATSWTSGDRTVACAVFSRNGATFDSRQL